VSSSPTRSEAGRRAVVGEPQRPGEQGTHGRAQARVGAPRGVDEVDEVGPGRRPGPRPRRCSAGRPRERWRPPPVRSGAGPARPGRRARTAPRVRRRPACPGRRRPSSTGTRPSHHRACRSGTRRSSRRTRRAHTPAGRSPERSRTRSCRGPPRSSPQVSVSQASPGSRTEFPQTGSPHRGAARDVPALAVRPAGRLVAALVAGDGAAGALLAVAGLARPARAVPAAAGAAGGAGRLVPAATVGPTGGRPAAAPEALAVGLAAVAAFRIVDPAVPADGRGGLLPGSCATC